jgi:cation:H+ antiporter
MTAPWVVVLLSGTPLPVVGVLYPAITLGTLTTVLVSGVAILGASFLLAWGAETAEEDVPRAFAIAVLAVLAVAPEYAVDAFYAWNAGAMAGTEAGAEAGNLAIANMTGANRILIGLGWSGIALFTIWRAKRKGDGAVRHRDGFMADVVTLDRGISTEIAFLAAATLWAFLVPLGDGIDVFDTVALVGLYVAYILVIIRAGAESETEHVGVPAYFQRYRRPARVAVVLFLFAYSGAMIFKAVEPFAHGLESLGLQYGIPRFFMIQWIAPLASESPELIVVTVLVLKARSTAGFNALISSKLNQWTLLIGTLAVVYSIALGGYGVLPFDQKQAYEIWLTAAQSYFALAILVNFEISVREAVGLLVLFVAQVGSEYLVLNVLAVANPEALGQTLLLVFTGVYLIVGTALFVRRRRGLATLLRLTADTIREATGRTGAPERAD